MKKKLLAIALTAASVGVLAGCNLGGAKTDIVDYLSEHGEEYGSKRYFQTVDKKTGAVYTVYLGESGSSTQLEVVAEAEIDGYYVSSAHSFKPGVYKQGTHQTYIVTSDRKNSAHTNDKVTNFGKWGQITSWRVEYTPTVGFDSEIVATFDQKAMEAYNAGVIALKVALGLKKVAWVSE